MKKGNKKEANVKKTKIKKCRRKIEKLLLYSS